MGGQEPAAKIAFGYIPIQNGFGSYVFLLDMRAYEGTSRNYRDATSQLTENGCQGRFQFAGFSRFDFAGSRHLFERITA